MFFRTTSLHFSSELLLISKQEQIYHRYTDIHQPYFYIYLYTNIFTCSFKHLECLKYNNWRSQILFDHKISALQDSYFTFPRRNLVNVSHIHHSVSLACLRKLFPSFFTLELNTYTHSSKKTFSSLPFYHSPSQSVTVFFNPSAIAVAQWCNVLTLQPE